jgi:hypothetical protein
VSLVETLSSTLLKLLPRAYFLKVRSSYLRLKTKASPLLRLVHGTFSTDELIAEIDRHLDDRLADPHGSQLGE